ncbi:SDR family NAD(P)-dependent oxidoreductase [Paenibacillus marinisediminis]
MIKGDWMQVLNNKVILITGGLGNLGRSAIKMFLDRGAIVYACDRIPIDTFPELLHLLDQYGETRFRFKQADVCEERDMISIVEEIESAYGRLDGAYHTVHTNVWKPVLELTMEEWDATIRGTLTSTFVVNKYALPLMIKTGGGSIVNTSSILGQIPSKGCLAYGAGKAGINQFTKVLALDYAQHGIRANVLVPGDFRSVESLAVQSEQEKAAMKNNSMLGRSASADEINEMACFLFSDASSYTTGALFTVDGGFHL